MTRTIEARALISAKDATGAVFDAVARRIERLNAKAAAASNRRAAADRRTEMVERVSSGAQRAQQTVMGASARILAPAAVAYGGVKALKRFGETDLALTRIGITADATDEQIGKLNKSMRELAFGTGKKFDEVTGGLESLVAGGMDLPQALPAMPAIAKTAQAAGAEVKDMATTTLALNQSLGISTDKMQAAFDILVTGGKAGKFELKDMARYMASIAPAAVAVGLKGEDGLKRIVAMMQTVRAGTGTTEEAASSLQNIFAKMESEETSNKFKKFGIDLRQEMVKARKEGRDLLTVFTELTEKATGGDLSKIPQLFSDMEFARGMRALLTFKDQFASVMAQLNNSAGSAMTDLERVLGRPKIAIDRLSESWDRLKTSAGAAIDAMGGSTALKKIAETFEETADYWNKPAAERGRIEAEKRRRSVIEPQIREIEQKIEYTERAEREQTKPSLLQRIRGEKLAPLHDRLESNPLLRELRSKLHDLRSQLNTKAGDDTPPIFSEKEVEQMQERDREHRRGVALSEMKETAKKKYVPMPEPDPRKGSPGESRFGESNIHDLPDRQQQGPITAELTGSAEVKGETIVTVRVEAGSELLRAVEGAKATARMAGTLNANGPGSTGKSSPDAGASRGAGEAGKDR